MMLPEADRPDDIADLDMEAVLFDHRSLLIYDVAKAAERAKNKAQK